MTPVPTVGETLRSAAQALLSHSDSPRLDAEVLLGNILGVSRAGLIAHSDAIVAADRERTYASLIERRVQGAPVAYLTGSREFWSLPLKVTPAVLVPRPETELLVELALQLLPEDSAAVPADQVRRVLDLGTGSGAIALAIASERPQARVTGVDISSEALEVAAQNSRDLQLALPASRLGSWHVEWRVGSWFDAVPGERFHLILANPPYIAADDPALDRLTAEPEIALCAGPTGLEALSVIAAQAPSYLHGGGWLIMEHGSEQAPDVARSLRRHGFSDIRSHLDFSGKPRVTLGTFTPHEERS